MGYLLTKEYSDEGQKKLCPEGLIQGPGIVGGIVNPNEGKANIYLNTGELAHYCTNDCSQVKICSHTQKRKLIELFNAPARES